MSENIIPARTENENVDLASRMLKIDRAASVTWELGHDGYTHFVVKRDFSLSPSPERV
jgi:hypothetical protein